MSGTFTPDQAVGETIVRGSSRSAFYGHVRSAPFFTWRRPISAASS
jgi:hypothetical protein